MCVQGADTDSVLEIGCPAAGLSSWIEELVRVIRNQHTGGTPVTVLLCCSAKFV